MSNAFLKTNNSTGRKFRSNTVEPAEGNSHFATKKYSNKRDIPLLKSH